MAVAQERHVLASIRPLAKERAPSKNLALKNSMSKALIVTCAHKSQYDHPLPSHDNVAFQHSVTHGHVA
jgi:hypothetical protein